MLSAIGDAVHVLPVVTALRRQWPDTEVTWVIQPVPRRLVGAHPAVHRFIEFERRRGRAGVAPFLDLRRRVKESDFDLALGLQVYFKAGVITALVRARVKLGFDRRRARDLNWLFTNHRIPPAPVAHVQDQYFEFLRHLGVDPEPVEWHLAPTPAEREERDAFFSRFDRPTCALVLGTSKPEKNWTAEAYRRLAEALVSDLGVQPLLVGGPSDGERRIGDHVRRGREKLVVDLLGDDLRRLLWLLDGCDLVVSPDTGPLHVARALETPVVGLYGYTNPLRYGPYRAFQDLIVDGYRRAPEEVIVPSMEYRDGMRRITVEQVLEKVELGLSRYVAPG